MTINRKFERVRARKLHLSNILPRRVCYDDDILESMRKDGVQQPLIIRPHPDIPGEYEIIDGSMRYWAFSPDDLVLVDVRYGIKDSEIFTISDMSFRRMQRITFERAEFLASWVRVEGRAQGKRGAQARVAEKARLTEGEISQYLAIHRMFTRLRELSAGTSETFDALKNQSINKLYELSRLTGTHAFLQVAVQLAENPRMPVRELRRIVEEETSTEKVLYRLVEEDLFETEPPKTIDYEKIAQLAQEMQEIDKDARRSLAAFEREIKREPEKFIESEILKELQRFKRRFKRLQKDLARLPDRLAAKTELTN